MMEVTVLYASKISILVYLLVLLNKKLNIAMITSQTPNLIDGLFILIHLAVKWLDLNWK